MNDEMDYLEHYDKYNDEQIEGYAIHDDMMSDVNVHVQKFLDELPKKLNQEELMKEVYCFVDELHEKSPELDQTYLFNFVMSKIQEGGVQ